MGYAKRGRDENLFPAETERRVQRLMQTLGQPGGLFRGLDIFQQDGELVSAKTGDGVAVAQGALEPPGGGKDQIVAMNMPETLVDDLEPVEIEEGDGKAGIGILAQTCECPAHEVEEQGPVGESGQCIMQGIMHKLLFGLFAPGDVGLASGDTVCRVIRTAHCEASGQHPEKGAICMANPEFAFEMRDFSGQMSINLCGDAGNIVRMNTAEPLYGTVGDLLVGQSKHFLPARR